jgi:hypothetical protein
MKSAWLVAAAIATALMIPMASQAANGIGAVTGTPSPEVVSPQTTPPPQTPAYPQPPIGTNQGLIVAPAPVGHASAPRVVSPAKPHG